MWDENGYRWMRERKITREYDKSKEKTRGGRIIGACGHGPVKVPRVRYGVVRYTIVFVPGDILI